MPNSVVIHENRAVFARATANRVLALIDTCLHRHARCTLALAGGSTPVAVYRAMRELPLAAELDWSRVTLLLGDERWVPADHPDSNQRMVRESLLADSPLAAARLLFPDTSLASPAASVDDYQQRLREELGPRPLDIVLLGMGEDGHTASLFPTDSTIESPGTLVIAVRRPDDGSKRISLSYSALADARRVLMLVAGAAKAPRLREVLQESSSEVPAARLARMRALEWHLDQDAAALVKTSV